MRSYGLIAAFLLLLALAGTALVLASHHAPAPDCTGRVVMMSGPHGAPLECVCVGGVMASCFAPGP